MVLIITIGNLNNPQEANAQLNHQYFPKNDVGCGPSIFDTDSLIESFVDAKGNDVEVWCVRNVNFFSQEAYYELRISYPVFTSGIIRHTAGGCYFDGGQNLGPILNGDKPGINDLQNVTWVNIDPKHPGTNYTFTYDWKTGNVTIIKFKNGTNFPPILYHPPSALDMELGKEYKHLGEAIADPAANHCTLDLPFSSLGFSKITGTLEVVVKDSITGTPVSGIQVHLKSLDKELDLTLRTNDTGMVAFPLDKGNYTVTALFQGFNMTLASSSTLPISFTGDSQIDLNLDSSILQTNAVISNGNLTSVHFDKNSSTMTLLMETSSTNIGQLTLTLPRSLMDAKMNSTDTSFIVMVDGKQTNYNETETSSKRILIIDIPAKAKEVDVKGTQSIPEFGPTSYLILLITLASIFIILQINYHKNRFS